MPITSPFELSKGPPELPGSKVASVHIIFGIGLCNAGDILVSLRIGGLSPIPATTPMDKKFLMPNGLPIASAICPVFTKSEFASLRGSICDTCFGFTTKRARSSDLLTPSGSADNRVPSARDT